MIVEALCDLVTKLASFVIHSTFSLSSSELIVVTYCS